MLNEPYRSPYESVLQSCPFRVPSTVKQAVLIALCRHVDSRAISTAQLIDEIRAAVPYCRLSDDQIEEYAVRSAIREEFAVRFDRRGRIARPGRIYSET